MKLEQTATSILGSNLRWSEQKLVATRKGHRLQIVARNPSNKVIEMVKRRATVYSNRGIEVVSDFDGNHLVYSTEAPSDMVTQNEETLRRKSWVPKMEINEQGLLKDYGQVDAVKRLVHALDRYGCAAELSDGGVGKTYICSGVARHLNVRPLIVCPVVSKPEWIKASKLLGVNPLAVLSWEAIRNGKHGYFRTVVDADAKKVTFEWYGLPENTLVVFDEAHYAKSENSLSGEMMYAIRHELVNRNNPRGVKVLLVSATLATAPHEMRASGVLLGLHKGGEDYGIWKSNLGCGVGQFGSYFKGDPKVMEDIYSLIIPKRGNRIRIADLGDVFPETQISACAYDAGRHTAKIKAVYDEMLERIAEIEAVEAGEKAIGRKRGIQTIILRARMKAEYLKVPMLVDLAKQYLELGHSVVLFTNFNKSRVALKKALMTDCEVCGGQSVRDRAESVRKFQSDEQRVIICNIRSGGVGLSLHDLNGKHPRAALINPTYSAFQLRQATFRVNRALAKTKSQQRIVFAAGTIEERVMESVQRKLVYLDALNDGDLRLTEKIYGA